jgi:hypothetical protein
MQEIGYAAEARAREIEPVIVYIPDREVESYEQGRLLRDHFKDCHFIVAENALIGKPDKQVQQSDHYKSLMAHELSLYIPLLDPMFASVVDDPKLSLSDFMGETAGERRPTAELSLAYLSLEARASIGGWLKEMLGEIRRLDEVIRLRADLSFRRPL